MEGPEYLFWMPTNEPSFVLPYRHQLQVANVIKAVKGQQLDTELYFSFLSDRVQYLLEQCDDPQDMLTYTYDVLERANLISIYEKTNRVKDAGKAFVLNNHLLREHLHLAGVFETMPKELIENNIEAEALFNRTDLENWFDAVTTSLSKDYR